MGLLLIHVFSLDLPWLNFGHGYSLPAMMPLWFSNSRQCSAVTDLMSKSWHKVSEEHNRKSADNWHKVCEKHNKSSTESWEKVSEEHNIQTKESCHKVNKEHSRKSEESWHKVSEEHNRSLGESWLKVSESDDRNSEEVNISDNTIKEEVSSDDIP